MRTCEELVESDEVAQRLAHLGAVYGNHIVVHPILHNRLAHCSHALRNLTFVVREHKVHTAAVNIELLAQIFAAHCSTLAVPAGEAVAPRRGPTHNVFGLCALPQSEVGRVAFLALAVELACGIEHLVKVTARQNAVIMRLVVLCNIKIYRALALIGKAVVQNLLHKLNLLYYVPRRVRFNAGRKHVQRLHHLVIVQSVLLHHLHRLQLLQTRLLRYLVLTLVGIVLQVAHIGNVAHIAHLVAQVLQVTEKHIESDCRAGVAQVSGTIHCGAAHIKAHIGRVQRLKKLFLARERVIYHKLIFHNRIYVLIICYLFRIQDAKIQRKNKIMKKQKRKRKFLTHNNKLRLCTTPAAPPYHYTITCNPSTAVAGAGG